MFAYQFYRKRDLKSYSQNEKHSSDKIHENEPFWFTLDYTKHCLTHLSCSTNVVLTLLSIHSYTDISVMWTTIGKIDEIY